MGIKYKIIYNLHSHFAERRDDLQLAVIIDPVLWPDLIKDLVEQDSPWVVLFTGKARPEFHYTMPFLVLIEYGSLFFQRVMSSIDQESLLFVELSTRDIYEVARSLSKVPNMYLKNEKIVYFRYYDPFMFNKYMEVCNAQQLSSIYGKSILSFYSIDVSNGFVRHYIRPIMMSKPEDKINILSDRQYEALLEAQYEKYLATLSGKIIADFYPTVTKGVAEAVRKNTHICAAMAQTYGITGRSGIYQFVRLCAEYDLLFPLDVERLHRYGATLEGLEEEAALSRFSREISGHSFFQQEFV